MCVFLVLHVSRVGHVLRHMPVRVRSVHMLLTNLVFSAVWLEFNLEIFQNPPSHYLGVQMLCI